MMSFEPMNLSGLATEAPYSPEMPRPLDSETLVTLGFFLRPMMTEAEDWTDLLKRMATKGYRLALRSGFLVVIDERDLPVCVSDAIFVPGFEIMERLGPPTVSANGGYIQ